MPQATWHFHLVKLTGRSGPLRFDYVVRRTTLTEVDPHSQSRWRDRPTDTPHMFAPIGQKSLMQSIALPTT